MSEEDNTQESVQDSSVEETTVDSQSETQTQDSNDDSSEQSSEQSGSETTDTASTGDTKPSETQDVKPETKPLSRRSAAYRIQQLTRENRELKQQQKPVQQEQDEWEENPQEDEQPDIASLVAKEVEKRLNPVISESTKTADDSEINELFSGDRASERSKYEDKIRDMWKLPQYKDVAAADLYAIATQSDIATKIAQAKLEAIEDYKKAVIEAKESSASGTSNTSNRTGKGGKSVNDMTDEEFRQHNERVKAGQA